MSNRRKISKNEREYVWKKADEVPGRDPDYYRQDKCGNVIYYDSYGKIQRWVGTLIIQSQLQRVVLIT